MELGSSQWCTTREETTGIGGNENFKLGTGESFFPVRTIQYWSRLPREAVQPPSLELFRMLLDKAVSSLV